MDHGANETTCDRIAISSIGQAGCRGANVPRGIVGVAAKRRRWHLSGLLALQSGNAEQAVERIRRAIRVNGNVAIYHCNLGVTLCLLNRADEAVASFRKAIDLNPSHAEAYNNLANALSHKASVTRRSTPGGGL